MTTPAKLSARSGSPDTLRLRPSVSLLLWALLLLVPTVPFLAGATAGDMGMLVGAAAFLVPSALMVAAWARSRVELGPDGLVKRSLWGTEAIGWEQVALVMWASNLITVVRRDGRHTALVRMGRGTAGGLTAEDVMALIRWRIDEHRPAGTAAERPVPETVELLADRRSARRLLTIAAVTVVLAVTAAVALGSPGIAVLPCGVGLLVGFLGVLTARSATRITPEGIRNRALRREVLVPWDDVKDVVVPQSPPRYIKVLRRSGGAVTLAAVADGRTGPEGLTFDDIAALVRHRAGLDGPSPEPETGPEAEPFTLRPSRRPLLWIVPAILASASGVVVTFRGDVDLTPVLGFLVPLMVIWTMLALKLLLGRTEAGPDGITNRLIVRPVTVPWRELDRLVLQPTPFGHIMQAVRTGGKRINLAAPRSGLLAPVPDFEDTARRVSALARAHDGRPTGEDLSPALSAKALRTFYAGLLAFLAVVAVVEWEPWLEPWWPGRAEATSVPRACAVADPLAARLLPGWERRSDDRREYDYFLISSCRWSPSEGAGEFELEYGLERRFLSDSGTDEAREKFGDEAKRLTGAVPVPGVGDEGRRETETEDGITRIHWLIRRANVVIELRLSGKRPAGRVTADADAMARAAVGALDVR